MSILDRIKAAAQARNSAQDGTKGVGYGYTGLQLPMFGSGYQNPILKVLGEYNDSQDPRPKLPTYRALAHNVTLIERAITLHRDFIGVPQLVVGETGDKKAVAILEKFWAETPVFGQFINPIAADRGIAAFVGQMIESASIDGSQFFRLMQQDGGGARVNKAPIEGLRLYDSQHFDYMQNPQDIERVILRYMSPANGVIDITPDMGYNEFHFAASPRFPWGKPLAYRAEFFCRQFIEFMIAHLDGTKRKANPIGITMMGYEEPPMTGLADAKLAAAEKQRRQTDLDTIAKSHMEAVKKSKRTQEPQDVIITVPSKVSIGTSWYGAGIEMPTNYEQMALDLTKDVALALDTPFMFLGIDQGGGGLGSSLFAFQKEAFLTTIGKKRQLLAQNCIDTINKAVLAANSIIYRPDSYTVEWQAPSLSDEKLAAETQKIEAEAVAQELANIATITTALSGVVDPDAAINGYAQEIGRPEWGV